MRERERERDTETHGSDVTIVALKAMNLHVPFAKTSHNRPLYLLLSGFARGQAVGCHAVARADRMQKSMQKHCRDHGKRPVCRSESSASSFNFFSKPLVLSLPPPRPSLG